jgi:uncharacterized membrane protein
MKFKATNNLDRAFEIGILIKGFDGVLEIIGGILLLFATPEGVNSLATRLTEHELVQDHRDFIATHIMHFAQHITGGALKFGAFYLLVHGIAKVFLVTEILQERYWAYLGLIGLTSAFVLYQLYRFSYDHSIGLLLLTAFDITVIILTLKEYRKRTRPKTQESSQTASSL